MLHCKAMGLPGLMRWFIMNHAPGAESLARPVDLKFSCAMPIMLKGRTSKYILNETSFQQIITMYT